MAKSLSVVKQDNCCIEDPIYYMLKYAIENIIKNYDDFEKVIEEKKNTKKEIKEISSKLEASVRTLNKKIIEEWIDSHKYELVVMPQNNADAQTVIYTTSIGIQVDTGNGIRKRYNQSDMKTGNPLVTSGKDWDMAIWRKKGDPEMNKGIQKIFKDKYTDLVETKGPMGHLISTTKIMGNEDSITTHDRHIFRMDQGENGMETRERLIDLKVKMKNNGRTKVAIPYEDTDKAEEFMEIIEEVMEGSEIQVAIPLPNRKDELSDDQSKHSGTSGSPTKNRKRGEAIIIKKEGEKTYASLLKEVREKVLGKGLEDNIQGVRETKKGELIITLNKTKKGEEMKTVLIEKMGKENVKMKKDTQEFVTFYVKDIGGITTKEDVETAIRKEIGDKKEEMDIEVKPLRPGFAGTQVATLVVEKEVAKELNRSKYIKIELPNCRIKQRVNVDYCYRCWETGHDANRCNGPDHSKDCKNCGEQGHEKKDCPNEAKCIICDQTGHAANTTRWPNLS